MIQDVRGSPTFVFCKLFVLKILEDSLVQNVETKINTLDIYFFDECQN